MVKVTAAVRTTSPIFGKLFGHGHKCQLVRHKSAASSGQPPLNVPLPGLPTPVYINPEQADHTLKMTVLKNGMRVATIPYFGNYCTIGVILDAGAKHAGNYVGGITHMLEKLAFNRTLAYDSKDSILLDLEKYGGICDCQADRDFIIYAVSAESQSVDPVTQILAETVLRAKITDIELRNAISSAMFDVDTLMSKPEQDQNMTELIHAAAFKDKTYGLPAIMPLENIKIVTRELIYTYMKNYYAPSRMVLCGVGVDHQKTVTAAEKYFQDSPPIWEVEKNLILEGRKYAPEKITPEYVGGIAWDCCEIPTYANADLPQLAHVVIALNAFPYADPDFISLCVLNLMMGGGNSFSAGGPGKGMYSRLYINALNRNHWMFSCSAFNHSYTSCGLFGIHASSPPEYLSRLISIIVKELCSVAEDDIRLPLKRAKAQLRSLYLMNLESRPMVFEDVARQVIALGSWKDRNYFIKEMDKVTAQDVQRVARRLLESQPSVAARGEIAAMPSYDAICQKFRSSSN